MEQVTIEFDEDDVAALERATARAGTSREATVRELLDAWLEQHRD
jgi:plasmid stability protein